jgi:hypothetical protein
MCGNGPFGHFVPYDSLPVRRRGWTGPPNSMNICINSRDLSECQRGRIEQYFEDHFTFDGRGPRLLWKDDESEYILLGFPQGQGMEENLKPLGRDAHEAPIVLFRVHEDELLRIAGRKEGDSHRCCESCAARMQTSGQSA